MKTILLLLTVLAFALPAVAQKQLREATAAEVTAGTIGLPAVLTPRRAVGNTNALTAAQKAVLALAVTNIYGYEEFVCVPYASAPPNVTNSIRYFGPWLGSNYIQQAINALPHYSNPTNTVGGGKIIIVGTNFYNSPLVFSNQLGGVDSYELCAQTFTGGSLICRNNPAIIVQGSLSDQIGSVEFTMRNLIVASTANDFPTNLFEIKGGVPHFVIENNWFGPWYYMTNQDNGGRLVPPTYGVGTTNQTNNLVVSFVDQYNDASYVERNQFWNIATVYWETDHGWIDNNFFTGCGGSTNSIFASASITSKWTSASSVALGASITLHGNDAHCMNNYFYGCQAAIAVLTQSTYGIGCAFGSQYEGCVRGIIAATNVYFPDINPSAYGQGTLPSDSVCSFPAPFYIVGTAVNQQRINFSSGRTVVGSSSVNMTLATNSIKFNNNSSGTFQSFSYDDVPTQGTLHMSGGRMELAGQVFFSDVTGIYNPPTGTHIIDENDYWLNGIQNGTNQAVYPHVTGLGVVTWTTTP
jgi:hypothetical protein